MKTAMAHLVFLVMALQVSGQGTALAQSAAARRTALFREVEKGTAAVSALSAALEDENPVVRRTAVRLLAEMGAAGRAELVRALGNSDSVVRRAALGALCDPPTIGLLPHLQAAIADTDPLVRLMAVHLLVKLEPRTEEVIAVLRRAQQDAWTAVRDVAAQALWPFHRDVVPIRLRPNWDHEIVIAQSIPLPKEGWRFKTDPELQGHTQGWFEPGFDDSAWETINIEVAWEQQGHDYDGVAWYRRWFDLPEKPDCIGAELVFEGVDEIAWVWVNGVYVGQHDIGPEGWDKAFTLDVTEELKWGQRNQITVRVHDSAFAGGIWKPVRVDVLR